LAYDATPDIWPSGCLEATLQAKREAELKKQIATVFAPATVGNVGPGFDVLGLAVDGIGDTVTVEAIFEKDSGDSGGCTTGIDEATGETWYVRAPEASRRVLCPIMSGE